MTETVTKKAKVLPFQRGDKMRREAAEWLVKLDNQLDRGGLSAAERAALRRWLGQNPEHGEILQRQAALWGDMDMLAARARTRARPRPRWFRAPAFALATLGALAIGFIGLRFLSVSGDPVAERLYATAVGEQREERLADGSRVHLNTDSLITVQFGAGERRVRLLRGEAAFDVVHDPERPFSVYAQNRIVTALGTRFTVRLGADNVQVAVATGKVALGRTSPGSASPGPVRRPAAQAAAEPAQEVMFLVQGQRAELPLADNAAPVLTAMDKQARERTFSWLQGRLIFDDERLATIVAEVSRYTAVQVTIAPELGDIRLSGRFKTGDTEALLEALALARRDLAIHRGGAGDTVYIATRPARAPSTRAHPTLAHPAREG